MSRRGVPLLMLSLLVCGCRQQMADQPSLRPLEASPLFPNRQSAGHLPPGVVPRDALLVGEVLTGMRGASDATASLTVARTDLERQPYLDRFPFPATGAVLRRSAERYMVFCRPCHDPVGYGNGVVVQRGYTPPPTFHSDRLRRAPPGYFYDVIRRGFGAMPEYGSLLPANDRWAIAAYVMVLQRSQYLPLGELPEPARQEILQHVEKTDGKRQ